MLTRISTIMMTIHTCVISLVGMDPEPIYDEEIDRSNAIICVDQDDEETEAEVWQAQLYDALVKNEQGKIVELLNVYNQVRDAPDIARFSDDEGRTFLMFAVCSKSFKIVNKLLRLVDPLLMKNYIACKNAHGHTALDCAADRRCMRIFYALAPYASQETCRAAIKYLYDVKDCEKVLQVHRCNMIFCLSTLSTQDPSDDEDYSPQPPTSPTSSTSSDGSDASIGDGETSVDVKTQ
jgi:ankyrin repeat protein